MDRFDQRRNVLCRRVLGNAVPQIENVAGIAGAKAIENFFRFCGDDLRRGKQHIRVEIALERHMLADAPTCFTEINGPVHANCITAGSGDGFQPQTAALGEDDGRDALTVFFADQAGQMRCM